MYLTRWRADLVTPGQAAKLSAEAGLPAEFAAAYAAYEWLKHNHVQFVGKIDFDDMLVMACQTLVSNPRLLSEVQNRWKVVLVDEAQDLNQAQSLLFGLIAGYYDPTTQQPWPDGRMTADTFAFVGDDAQAIYGFRGADVELFIDKSDKVGGDFKTKEIATNYRSGKAIVDAAGQLIKHNTKQIPMECKANEARKGMGFIHAVHVKDHEAGAAMVAEEIKDLVSSGTENLGEPKGVPTFGIGVRTNAEAYDFAAEMLKRGLPFKSKVNFFNDKTTNAILNWMVIAADPDNKTAVNEAILEAHDAPKFYLDKVFNQRLQELARGQNYLTFLENGGWRDIYQGRLAWKNEKNVLPYTKALRTVADLRTSAGPKQILDVILNLKGLGVAGKPGLSMLDSLIEDAKDDPELLDTIREETEGEPGLEGQFTDDDVKALALAPIKPLIGLLEGYEDLGQAMIYIKKLQAANEKTDKGRKRGKDGEEDQEESVEPAVIIDTIHGWKGLEAKRMYVPMAKGTFPHAKSATPDALEAERRLGYVAITRGQDRVTILVPDVNHQGQPGGPSRFVGEACIVLEGDEEDPAVVPGAEPGAVLPSPGPGTTAAAFDLATAALNEAAVILGEGLASDDPGLAPAPEPEEHQEAPDDLLMTDAQEDAAEDGDEALSDQGGPEEEAAEEIAASAAEALAQSQALMAKLKR
jgi:superfamily I DNA/RNA helicase